MNRTFCDFYAFRVRCDHMKVIEALRLAMGKEGGKLGHTLQKGGWHGYESKSLLNYSGTPAGLVAWGGEYQKGWVHASLTGGGCEFVESWEFFEAVVQALPEFSYRRIDLALDVADGACSHDKTVEAHRRGSFDGRGHRPKAQRIEPEDRREGCTFYVGDRKSFRFFRGYEKGKQLRSMIGLKDITEIDGVPVDDLYRLEVEFKAAQGVELPLDLVLERDRHFAGAYPYLAEVLATTAPRSIRYARKHTVHADITRALESCRTMFGPALLAALNVNHGNVDAVWRQIVGAKITERWVAAGALIKGDRT